ncbi:MAG: hypothetical protein HY696_01965 [Deltaproteobacteria bacterium]|nr:hypothetical protein [Deltaproteobacteria bacterium]
MLRLIQWSFRIVLLAIAGLAMPTFDAAALSVSAPPENPQQIDLAHEVGRQTTVRGVARDSKAGAIIVLAQGEVIYIDGLSEWPAELHGKQVSAHGLLKRRKYIPDPTIGPDGGIAQGAKGLQFVLTRARWQLAR